MSWESIRFEELYSVPSRNGIYKAADSHGQGYKIVNMGEIFAYDFIGNQEMQRITLDDTEIDRFGIEENDLLFARRSLVEVGAGKSSIVVGLSEKTTFESSIIRVRLDASKCVPLFYHYWFRSLPGRTAISSLVTGTNVKGIRGSALKDIIIDYPDYSLQKKISDCLKTYDDLIENNRKQIKLLEEAAQRLYKEWFVDLRFPGYESTPIVDGLPEGWKTGTLSDVARFVRGKVITKNQAVNGAVPVVAGGLEPAYYHNIANTVAPVVTVSGSGANAGFTRMYYENIFASDCSFVDNSGGNEVFFAYCFLKDEKTRIKALQKGSAQPHVYAKDLNAMELVIPDSTTIERFNKTVAPLFLKIGNCEKMMKDLGQARDRLLPKLMSGEMEG